MSEPAVANLSLAPLSREPRMTETALELAPDLTAMEWEEIGHTLGRANRASAWWIGDWVNYGEAKWGETYDEAERITGLTNSTLRIYAHTSKRFPFVDRINKLSFGHHRLVAPIEDLDERREVLALAAGEDWGRDRLRSHLSNKPVAEPLGVYFGKGDKWRDATEPIRRYLAAWEKRGYQFGHVNPREAGKRVALIDELIDALQTARTDLEPRSHRARPFSLGGQL